jgi:AcrR family transcriptional regulator
MNMDGFARRKEQSKEEIRKAAWELFSQFGVDKVSMMDISRKAGVSQATIYNNFGSKEALVRDFFTAVIDHLVISAHMALSPDKPFWDKMVSFFEFISEMMAQGGSSEDDAIVFSANNGLLNDPEINKIRVSAQEKMTGLLLGLVQEGKEQNQIRSDLSEASLRVYFTAFMEMFTNLHFRQAYRRDPKILQDLSSLMIYGLSGRKNT